MNDSEIIDLYFQRDEQAIVETDSKYGNFCAYISGNILNNKQDVEECVNDTYLRTWNSIPPTVPNSLKAYLGRIVRNISLNHFKANHTQKRYAGQADLVYEEFAAILPSRDMLEDLVDSMQLREAIVTWLDALSDIQRAVFVGRYWYFDSIQIIADKMDCSPARIKMILHRLRKQLKSHLEAEGYYL